LKEFEDARNGEQTIDFCATARRGNWNNSGRYGDEGGACGIAIGLIETTGAGAGVYALVLEHGPVISDSRPPPICC